MKVPLLEEQENQERERNRQEEDRLSKPRRDSEIIHHRSSETVEDDHVGPAQLLIITNLS